MTLDLVQTLADLVALPSVNPMGRPVTGPEYFEGRVTDYLETLFQRLGWPAERETIEPGRDNIVACIPGDVSPDKGGRLILFEAHQDTVPVDGMTIDPWRPTVRDGRLFGRGSCDIKGGMTAMLGAAARLSGERPAGRPTVIMACTVNEEHGFSGATALARRWQASPAIGVIPRRPDAAIVAEPTELDVVVAHKGAVRWRMCTRGRAGHSSQPERCDNAVYKMARALGALERYARDVVPGLVPAHPLCGRATLSVGSIAGGLSVNTVPDRCVIEIDRRLLPGEVPEGAYRHAVEYVAGETGLGDGLLSEPPFLTSQGLGDEDNGPLAERLLAAAESVRPGRRRVGVPYGTDASTIAAAGVPTVVFGPGSIEQAHTCDEWLAIDQLELASEILFRFLLSECA